jgi:hypothetical protein
MVHLIRMGVHRRVIDLLHVFWVQAAVVFWYGLKQHFHWIF